MNPAVLLRMKRSRAWVVHWCAPSLLVITALACANGEELSGPVPSPDGQLFVQQVYPLLLRDCAFSDCHGATDRFFQLYGPGRVRLAPLTTKPDDPMTLPELLHSYDRARSMLATSNHVETSLLLTKPLEPIAGGQGHRGVDDFGRNLFASTNDPNYALLLRWANTPGLPPTAAELSAATVTPSGGTP